ncbi:type 4b pilus protein PilO2 [Pseudomonas fluorescens]|uniref:Pilus assembly protein PilO n=1 Tax=Pseudomonas fluorescens TaxID=294 RepID=A0A2T0HND2_PSEFL|nr:type 4b pilus protein PilO2 [Pseudomonas fluorescens]PRW84473.1 pilus assembly protein PilO [Pseudomonas fluorescens]
MPIIPNTDISTVKINGKEFVSGLMWRPLDRPRAYMAEAREVGKKFKMDIVAIRSGHIIQAGFVSKGNGVTKGMYSLACALAGQVKHESWIGAFELPDGRFALVAVFDGLILPDCDVIGDRQEIRNLLLEKDSQPKTMNFEKVYHPDSFGHRGEPLDIENLLIPSAMRKEYALKQLTFGLTKKEIVSGSCIAFMLLGALIGYQQWQAYQAREAQKEAHRLEQIRLSKLAELNALAGAEQTVKALLHPWATMPGVEDFLNGCQGAIESLPLSVGGWTFDSALCNAATVESVFGRSGKTTFLDFYQATQGRFPSPPVLLDGAERAGLGDEIKLGAGGDDELLPFEQLQADFTSHLQKLDLKAVVVEVPVVPPAPPPLPGEAQGHAAPVPDWKKFSFSFTSQYTPKFIFSGVNLRGFRLVEISVVRQGHQLSWSLKGELYAR